MDMKTFYEIDSKVKILAKELREGYKQRFKDTDFFAINSTKSEKKELLSLSCYPKAAMETVLSDSHFKRFLIQNNLEFKLEIKEEKALFKINLSELKKE